MVDWWHADVREVFDLFDFWDGRDGLVDGFKLGDFLRCCGLNPTCTLVIENGGTKKLGIIISNLRIYVSLIQGRRSLWDRGDMSPQYFRSDVV